jgi:hypothetical protein
MEMRSLTSLSQFFGNQGQNTFLEFFQFPELFCLKISLESSILYHCINRYKFMPLSCIWKTIQNYNKMFQNILTNVATDFYGTGLT